MHVILGSWGRKVQNLRPAWAICSETVCLTLGLVSQSSKQSCTHRAMCFSLSRLPVVQGWPWECLGSACSLMLLSAHAPAPSSKGVSFSLDFSPGEGKRSDCVFPTSFASSRVGLVAAGIEGPISDWCSFLLFVLRKSSEFERTNKAISLLLPFGSFTRLKWAGDGIPQFFLKGRPPTNPLVPVLYFVLLSLKRESILDSGRLFM